MNMPEIVGLFFKASLLLFFIFMVVLILTLAERKALARIQQRKGPNRVGFKGILQPFADALKLLTKEDILPASANKQIFWIAPLAVFLPGFLIWVTIPLAKEVVLANLDMGLFYITAISVLSVMGLLMAGWGSANKWAMIGGLRAAGQLISYEIPFIMAILAIGILAQSFNLKEIVDDQARWPFAIKQPLGLFIFLTAGLAELGRTPFDIHHAESEVVGGPFVEYSGAHWSVFYLAEYMNTFTIAVLTVLLFLGGWQSPALPFSGIVQTVASLSWFLIKTALVIWVIFWIRGTYPRLRIDQLMSFGWKILVPASFINIFLTASVLYYALPHWVITVVSLGFLGVAFYFIKKGSLAGHKQDTVTIINSSDIRAQLSNRAEV
ncbi:MAG: NADH-quinone oxidoreductase subunit NuoH [SAR202 cluster bacterium]|nr:NADH-quinone oxidoreductase subunit NuoH [SAR202 cluster bacterium]